MKLRLFFAVLFAQVLSMAAYAYDAMIDGIYYNFNGEEAEVTYKSEETDNSDYSGEITIPTSVTYDDKTYVVTSIGDFAFWNCSGLTAITIPEGVTSIGVGAFQSCSSLTAITIPESVTNIGEGAFEGCSIFGDKGYIGAEIQLDLFETANIRLECPYRLNQKNWKPTFIPLQRQERGSRLCSNNLQTSSSSSGTTPRKPAVFLPEWWAKSVR